MADETALDTPLLASLRSRVEAAVFAARKPVRVEDLAALLPRGVDVAATLREAAAFWSDRGIALAEGPDGWSMAARAELLPEVEGPPLRRMSEAAGATLMAIAMHQPVTIRQLETVRGVRLARGIVESLEASGFVRVADRRRATGRAALYETTERFLDATGLEQLSDLPTPEEALMMDLDAPAPVQVPPPGR